MVTMTAPPRPVVANVHCSCCGTVLAERREAGEGTALRLSSDVVRPAVQVVVAGRRRIRCTRCHARTLVDLDN
jgi:hypothetical protein